MAEDNETVADIVREMREMPNDLIVDANANFVFAKYANRIEAAHRREVAQLKRQRGESEITVRTDNSAVIANLQLRLKVAEDALTDLQSRLVASVYDGSMNPHEALKVADDALAAIRKKGADHE